MRCSKFLSKYTDYRDQTADRGTIAEMELHLASCPRCRRHDASMRIGVAALLENELEVTDQSRINLRVRLALSRRPRRTVTAAFPLAASIAMVAFAGTWGALGSPRVVQAPVATIPAVQTDAFVPRGVARSSTRSDARATDPPAPLEYAATYAPVQYRTAGFSPGR